MPGLEMQTRCTCLFSEPIEIQNMMKPGREEARGHSCLQLSEVAVSNRKQDPLQSSIFCYTQSIWVGSQKTKSDDTSWPYRGDTVTPVERNANYNSIATEPSVKATSVADRRGRSK